jgi:hypothetical protein
MEYITPKHLRKWGACYTDERIAELVPKTGLTVHGYLALDISDRDKIWLVTRPKVLSNPVLYNWLALTVERALGRVQIKNPSLISVIAYLKRRAAGGPVERDIVDAAYAAYTATYAYAAAYIYTVTAAAYACTVADSAASASASAHTAYTATYAYSDERALQVKDLLGLLNADKT